MSAGSSIHTAMIMAAGLSTRMRPLTDDRPKPLVVFAGRPLIDIALDRVAAAGLRRAVVNLHYKADQLEAHLRKRAAERPPEIVISDERAELLDTGGGLKNALPLLGEEPVVTYNSDAVWIEGMGSTLSRLMTAWDPARMDALLLVAPTVTTIGQVYRGDFMMDPLGRLSRRPPGRIAPYLYAGVQIIKPELFADGPDGPFSTNLIWDRLIAKDRLFGLRIDGVWMHVGTPEDLEEAEAFLTEEIA